MTLLDHRGDGAELDGVGGLILGLSRTTIVEFSFLLAVPTMLAATGYDLLKNASFEAQQFGVLAAGFISAFFVALLSIKFLLAFVRTRTFIPFGLQHRRGARLRPPLTRQARAAQRGALELAG
jgi:Bacitracin resistance protein BacA